jgi:multidrug efflux system membrane fusion protein
MKTAGRSRVASRSRLISLAVIFLAAALAFYAFHESNIHPTSSDSSIDADIVHVAAAVGGRIIELPVSENAHVTNGALLFQIDPARRVCRNRRLGQQAHCRGRRSSERCRLHW